MALNYVTLLSNARITINDSGDGTTINISIRKPSASPTQVADGILVSPLANPVPITQTLQVEEEAKANALSNAGVALSGEKGCASMDRRSGRSPVVNESDATCVSLPLPSPLASSSTRSPAVVASTSLEVANDQNVDRLMHDNSRTQSAPIPSPVGEQALTLSGCVDSLCDANLASVKLEELDGDLSSHLVISRDTLSRNSPKNQTHKLSSRACDDGACMTSNTNHNQKGTVKAISNPDSINKNINDVGIVKRTSSQNIGQSDIAINDKNVLQSCKPKQIETATTPKVLKDAAVQTYSVKSNKSAKDIPQDKRSQKHDTTKARHANAQALTPPSHKGSNAYQIRTEQKWNAMRKEVIDVRAMNEELRMENRELKREREEMRKQMMRLEELVKLRENEGREKKRQAGNGTGIIRMEATTTSSSSSKGQQTWSPLARSQKRKRVDEVTQAPTKRSRVSADMIGASKYQSANNNSDANKNRIG